jgi:hypothetical protein
MTSFRYSPKSAFDECIREEKWKKSLATTVRDECQVGLLAEPEREVAIVILDATYDRRVGARDEEYSHNFAHFPL